MDQKNERILRAIMEGMTEGIDMLGKMKTWERTIRAAKGLRFEAADEGRRSLESKIREFTAPLGEVEIEREFYHKAVVDACSEGAATVPSLDYPEATKDRMGVEERGVESYLTTDELLLIGQAQMISRLCQILKSEDLREKLARKVMIKLI